MQRLQLFLLLCASLLINSLGAQCVKGDCYDGLGAFVFASGSRYIGQFSKGQPHGNGSFYFTDGRKYIGSFYQSQIEGNGKLYYPDGSIYEGGFQRGLRSGKGTLRMTDNSLYDGEWQGDKLHGEVTYVSSDGWSYLGIWEDDVPSLEGGQCYIEGAVKFMDFQSCREAATGKIEVNEYTPDVEVMELTYFFQDGSRWFGPLEGEYPQGKGRCEFPDGRVYYGDWQKSYPHGLGGLVYADGTISYGRWESGVLKEQLDTPYEMVKENIHKSKPIESTGNTRAKVWAVVVGVAQYETMPSLKYSDDDAYLMYAFYKSPEGGALPDNQLSVLIDEGANRRNIMAALQEKAAMADTNDVLVFFFSGHGLKNNLVPQDFDGSRNLIAYDEVMDILNKSDARQKVCYIDACYSGSIDRAKIGLDKTLNLFYDGLGKSKPGVALILSSKETEVSLENSGLRQGVFSHYLIRGLKGKADKNKDSVVDVQELFSYLHTEVNEYTQGRQNPVLSGNYDTHMPVGVLRQQ